MMTTKLKIGIDIHGVADNYSAFFAQFTRLLVDHGHEVHIMTGSRRSLAMKEMEGLGLSFTHFFSITDHHEAMGTEVVNDAEGNPHMPASVWNPTKAEYAKRHGLQMVIDDSPTYGHYFSEDMECVYAQVYRTKPATTDFNPRT